MSADAPAVVPPLPYAIKRARNRAQKKNIFHTHEGQRTEEILSQVRAEKNTGAPGVKNKKGTP